MRIIGIDPGVSGAIALIERPARTAHSQFVDVADMPTMVRNRTARVQKQEVNAAQLAKIIRTFAPDEAYVELVAAIARRKGKKPPCKECGHEEGGMGAVSSFNFGDSFGIVKGVLGALGVRYELVTPGQWKTLAGLRGTTKAQSRTLAQRIFPDAPLELAKHDGRAEALLIADTCSRVTWSA